MENSSCRSEQRKAKKNVTTLAENGNCEKRPNEHGAARTTRHANRRQVATKQSATNARALPGRWCRRAHRHSRGRGAANCANRCFLSWDCTNRHSRSRRIARKWTTCLRETKKKHDGSVRKRSFARGDNAPTARKPIIANRRFSVVEDEAVLAEEEALIGGFLWGVVIVDRSICNLFFFKKMSQYAIY